MAKSIYRQYKNRLVEISGNNKCLCLSRISRRSAYDLGKLLEGRESKIAAFNNHFSAMEHTFFPLISAEELPAVTSALGHRSTMERRVEGLPAKEVIKNTAPRTPDGEIAALRDLKKEADELERETGRHELYLGYPFVFGELHGGGAKTVVKAPLLLFPVNIEFPDEETVGLRVCQGAKVELNRALIFAYAQSKNLNVDAMDLEFDDLERFRDLKKLLSYLASFGIRFECQETSRNIFPFDRFKEPNGKGRPTIRRAAVVGRFPLSGSIYNDYSLLEKKRLNPPALTELITPAKCRATPSRRTPEPSYTVKNLDFAQSEVIRAVSGHGNTVIWGPPGTGKSQTIVAVIADAICKNKRVLVVSQKKAALDVVYNRLGELNGKAMYIVDETKEKQDFYARCLDAHQKRMIESLVDVAALEKEYRDLDEKIAENVEILRKIDETQNRVRPFGISLAEMYASSKCFAKNTTEYEIYTRMLGCRRIMEMDYKRLSSALFTVRSKDLAKLYFDFVTDEEKNPILPCIRQDIDMATLRDAKAALEDAARKRTAHFKTEKYPLWRKALTYLYSLTDEKVCDALVKTECRIAAKKGAPSDKAAVRKEFERTAVAIESFAEPYRFLHAVLTDDGFLSVLSELLCGKGSPLRQIADLLADYVALRDRKALISSMDDDVTAVLEFAYSEAKNYPAYLGVLEKILPVRIYHEVIRAEDSEKKSLAKTIDFVNITSQIEELQRKRTDVAMRLCVGKNSRSYDDLYAKAKNNKDYLYQISKKQNFWPIRKMMEEYGEFVLSLFPCWLLSPECVSGLLPLQKDLFDLVVFDEASQVFIESSVPAIVRGKNIVVAGDAKQLRPSATFMKRYMGADPDDEDDYSYRAALEVESLLDLAVARYASANLTYHYRSRSSELIDFSNYAYYDGGLQVAPNVTKNVKVPPIERIKVSGKWVDRKNEEEAAKVVSVLDKLLKTRKRGESIGIITFNADQQACIQNRIEKLAAKDEIFRVLVAREQNRKEGGEDTSLFVKNLENVQGDERDIIIFSIGYAPNESGKVYANFGSLSAEGGENRLNVAVTRAKSRIIVVTSIEPEELKVQDAKNAGPGLLKKYLEYVRAVSGGNTAEVKRILESLCPAETQKCAATGIGHSDVVQDLKTKLERLGYTVDVGLGNRKSRISLAIYDLETDRYLVGVELDEDAAAASDSILERDVFRPKFLASRGWNLIRVFRRDFWNNPQKVVKTIASAATAEKNKLRAKVIKE